jgi:peroxiredoxin Q/BCP
MAARKKAAKKSAQRKTAKKKAAKKVAARGKKAAPKKRAAVKKASAKSAARSIDGARKPSAIAPQAASFVGKAAPPFTLPTGDGKTISLSEFRGQRVLLYFYPKDDTPGCTAQACALRDNMDQFAKANTIVIGVSKDDVLSHRRFKDKYQLNFLLASDKDTGVSEKYGVWVEKNMYGRRYMGIQRSTFLIDENGIVRAEWRKVSVPDHARDVRDALAAL